MYTDTASLQSPTPLAALRFPDPKRKPEPEGQLKKQPASPQQRDQRVEQAKRSLAETGQYLHQGKRFCSRSEAACAALMERYIKGWETIAGYTFQVAIGKSEAGDTKYADFCVKDTVIEFHPPRFPGRGKKKGDFLTLQDARNYRKLRFSSSLSREQKKTLRKLTRIQLEKNYFDTRKALIDSHPDHSGKELIVVTSREEFYDKILKRFATNGLPDKATVMREFKQEVSKTKDLSPKHKKRKSSKNKRISNRNRSSRRRRKAG